MPCLLSSAYLAPLSYYTKLLQYDKVYVEQYDHYQKQTYRNRCLIASPNGVQALTIPVVKPDAPKAYMRDIRISDHGNWRHLHWQALISSYHRTPFFEFYADDFAPFYEKRYAFLLDFNEALQNMVCDLMGIETQSERTTAYELNVDGIDDFRYLVEPSKNSSFPARPYYQMFSERQGFQPNLSIVDLLFNMGPESILYLQP
ncbi:MAG: WbqC family protein [Bacteroidaceae bacterium]|nr:WbqC family protein [Bacteroidaceae bacterium]